MLLKDASIFTLLFILSLVAGQIVRIPILGSANLTVLDLMLVSFVFYGLFKSNFRSPAPPLFIKLGLVFLIIGTFSLLISPLQLNLEQKLISFFYGARFLLILVAGWLIINKSIFKSIELTAVLITSGLAISVLGFLQFIVLPNLQFLAQFGWDPHLYRLASTFLDPNFTGSYLTLTLIMIFFSDKKSILKWRGILFGIVFIALLLTFSRSAYICFIASFLLISVLQKSLKTLILTIVLTIILLAGFNIYQKIIATPNNVDRTQSAQTRIDSWQQGIIIFNQNPILGIGFNSYRYGLEKFQLAPIAEIQTHGGSSNDSSLLHVLATTGLLGFLAYLLFLGEILRTGWQSYRKHQTAGIILIAATIGLLFQSFFVNILFYPFLLIWIILLGVSTNQDLKARTL